LEQLSSIDLPFFPCSPLVCGAGGKLRGSAAAAELDDLAINSTGRRRRRRSVTAKAAGGPAEMLCRCSRGRRIPVLISTL